MVKQLSIWTAELQTHLELEAKGVTGGLLTELERYAKRLVMPGTLFSRQGQKLGLILRPRLLSGYVHDVANRLTVYSVSSIVV
jgi:hypothetical protein